MLNHSNNCFFTFLDSEDNEMSRKNECKFCSFNHAYVRGNFWYYIILIFTDIDNGFGIIGPKK